VAPLGSHDLPIRWTARLVARRRSARTTSRSA